MTLLLWAPGLAAQAACGTSVTVRSGETLAGIAARCNTSVTALVRANDQIEDPNLIEVGWVLTIPTRVEQASPEAEPEEPEGERPVERPVERPLRWDPGERYPNAAVRSVRGRATPGETVHLSARGLPADTRVNIGVGPWRSEYTVVQEARTDEGGRLVTPVQMPDWADPGDRFVFVVETPDRAVRVMTDPVVVVRRDERPDAPGPDLEPGKWVRMTGTLTGEGVRCQALRTRTGDLFTLTGEPRGFESGDRVQVVGTVREASVCQQGVTLEVEDMAAVDEDFGDLKPVVRVEGRLTGDGVECQALRSDSGELYTLVGNLEGFHMGQQVYVEGTETEVSVCQQGTTLKLRVIRERGPRSGS